MELLDHLIYQNTVRQWLIALAASLVTFAGLRLIIYVVRNRLTALASRTQTEWDDVVVYVLSKTKGLMLLLVALFIGSQLVSLPDRAGRIISNITILGLLFQAGIWFSAGLGAFLERYTRRELATDRGAATTISALGFVGKLVIWAVLLLVALDNLGVDITTLVAGLGVGGVAVALATQNILGDLFASLSIVLDKPFVLGDFIIVDEMQGTVEHIGLKTTRVRSLWGEQVVFSNADLLKSRLRNFGRMMERRVNFKLGVTYQTPREKLTLIPEIVREAITSQDRTRFDRSHFASFGDSALVFDSVYYVLSSEYLVYMNIQQAINLRIHERFEEEGIEFAYPTQTVVLTRPLAAS
ncbi:MAG TPA: mechanosensitive ion channel family protein [Gemmatimonadales bacterium]|nr:mechanosensitive ion channel family protein [Gemmatimonadales bacterium]